MNFSTVFVLIGDFFRDLWGDYAGWAQSVSDFSVSNGLIV